MKLLRTLVGLGAVATTLALTAAPAGADHDYYPGPGDFADCPAQPAGVTSWTCYAHTAVDGGFTLGTKKGVRVLLDKNLRLTLGQGKLADGTNVARLGGITGEYLKVVTVIPGTNAILSVLPEVTVQVVPVKLVDPTSIESVAVKLRLVNGFLGPNCSIGTDAAPIVLRPHTDVALPWLFWLTPGVKAWASDRQYALPAATSCGSLPLLGGVDSYLGLPSAAGNGTAEIVWAVREKKL
ncbi:MAG: hypothetical protein ABIS86_01590 [Streptosporangiaceae bacterium]